jgi:hypothetical protein
MSLPPETPTPAPKPATPLTRAELLRRARQIMLDAEARRDALAQAEAARWSDDRPAPP